MNLMRHWRVAGAMVVGAGISGFAAARWATNVAAEEILRLSVQLEAKDKQIAELTERLNAERATQTLAALGEAHARIMGGPSDLPPAALARLSTPEPPATADLSRDLRAKEILAKRRAEVQALEGRLAEEEIDRGWATEAEGRVKALVNGLGERVELREASCRTTLCRVVVQHADPETRSEDLNHIIGAGEPGGQVLVDVPVESEETSVVYLSRENKELGVF